MNLRKDKPKVVGETFDDERIRGFLGQTAPAGYAVDFYVLERAYRGMLADNFATFVRFFTEAGRDINACNPDGRTLTDLVATHRRSGEYLEILKRAGGTVTASEESAE